MCVLVFCFELLGYITGSKARIFQTCRQHARHSNFLQSPFSCSVGIVVRKDVFARMAPDAEAILQFSANRYVSEFDHLKSHLCRLQKMRYKEAN